MALTTAWPLIEMAIFGLLGATTMASLVSLELITSALSLLKLQSPGARALYQTSHVEKSMPLTLILTAVFTLGATAWMANLVMAASLS